MGAVGLINFQLNGRELITIQCVQRQTDAKTGDDPMYTTKFSSVNIHSDTARSVTESVMWPRQACQSFAAGFFQILPRSWLICVTKIWCEPNTLSLFPLRKDNFDVRIAKQLWGHFAHLHDPLLDTVYPQCFALRTLLRKLPHNFNDLLHYSRTVIFEPNHVNPVATFRMWKWYVESYWLNLFSLWHDGLSENSCYGMESWKNCLTLWNFKAGCLTSELIFVCELPILRSKCWIKEVETIIN